MMMTFGYVIWSALVTVLLWTALPCNGQNEPVKMTYLAIGHFESEGTNPRYQCHISSPDGNAQVVSFRKTNTRNGLDLNNPPPPPASYVTGAYPHWRVELDNNNNNDAFGVFGCAASLNGKQTEISGTFMRSDADVVPADDLFTKIVNVGDTGVGITMRTSDGSTHDVSEFIWMKDNVNLQTGGVDTYHVSDPVTINDAGVYECFIDSERNDAKQGLQLLIVRACPANHWGQGCNDVCNHCFNGGICDENTGNCICPPGFAGANCETACGGNRYGISCDDKRCSGTDEEDRCRNFLFCLPHPFGCRCNTGWKGLGCSEVCNQGTYGASCLQSCMNCRSGMCNRFTGVCTGIPTGCNNGWTGDSCQQPDCPGDMFGPTCEGTCHCHLGVCDDFSGECSPPGCEEGWTGSNCQDACTQGSFGLDCRETCHCRSTQCDRFTGQCTGSPSGCSAGWEGSNCQDACDQESFGFDCVGTCHCRSNQCDRFSGECTGSPSGCSAGWEGDNCQDACDQESFGFDCVGTCHCRSNQCDRFTGQCTGSPSGCSAGWEGINCQNACAQGSFGSDCLETCHCRSNECDRFSGECTGSPLGCSAGWEGSNCQDACQYPMFDLECSRVCQCPDENCEHISGCDGNCYDGWATLDTAMCQIGIVDSGFTRTNPEMSVPVTCTINKDPGRHFRELNLVISRNEETLDNFGITCDDLTGNSTARTLSCTADGVNDNSTLYCQLWKDGDRLAGLGILIDLYDLPVLKSPPKEESVEDTSVTITWVEWDPSDGGDPPVVGYIPYYRQSPIDEWAAGGNATENLAFTFMDLNPETSYSFSVAAVREGDLGEGPRSPNITVQTVCSAPSSGPLNVAADVSGNRQQHVEITWQIPSVENINCGSGVSKYTVYYSKTAQQSLAAQETREIFNPGANSYVFEDLDVGKSYSFQVSLTTEGGESSLSDPVNHLLPILPSLQNPPNVDSRTICGSEVNMTWTGWTEGKDEGTPPIIGYIPYYMLASDGVWIADEFVVHISDNVPMTFTFTNLAVSSLYNFALSVVREGDGGEGDKSDTISHKKCETDAHLGAIIGAIFGGVLLMLLLLLGIYWIKRWKSRTKSPDGQQANMKGVESELSVQPASEYECINNGASAAGGEYEQLQKNANTNEKIIDLGNVNSSYDRELCKSFPDKYKNSTMAYENTDLGPSSKQPLQVSTFSEFMRLSTATETIASDFRILDNLSPKMNIHVAEGASQDNLKKNRFPNIIPLDKCRTKLGSLSLAGGNDYVNACLVNIGHIDQNIIMAQAPLPETVEDFWRLVFDYECQTIIMLNEEYSQKQRIVKYWPDFDDHHQFGAMEVSVTLCAKKSTYTIRQFEVSHQSFKKVRHVKQFAYRNWPAKDGKLSALASFINEIGFGRMSSSGLTILQCIDGAGRSGIYATVAAEIKRIQEDRTIKLFDTLENIRHQNPFAVNTQEDYLMCHRIIDSYITEVQAYDVIA